QGSLEALEQRPLRRCAAQKHERVVRDAHERRCENGYERLVVVAVVQQAEVGKQVGDLLLTEVAAPGRPVGRQTELSELLLVPLGIRSSGEKQHDLSRLRGAGLDQLPDPARHRTRLAAAPMRARAAVARLVGYQQL